MGGRWTYERNKKKMVQRERETERERDNQRNKYQESDNQTDENIVTKQAEDTKVRLAGERMTQKASQRNTRINEDRKRTRETRKTVRKREKIKDTNRDVMRRDEREEDILNER